MRCPKTATTHSHWTTMETTGSAPSLQTDVRGLKPAMSPMSVKEFCGITSRASSYQQPSEVTSLLNAAMKIMISWFLSFHGISHLPPKIASVSIQSQEDITAATLTIEAPDDEYDVGLQKQPGKPLPGDNFTRWSIGEDPMWLNFADPTIINLHNTSWSKDYVVVTRPKDFKEDQWVFLAITAPPRNILPNKRKFVPVAHPVRHA